MKNFPSLLKHHFLLVIGYAFFPFPLLCFQKGIGKGASFKGLKDGIVKNWNVFMGKSLLGEGRGNIASCL